MSALRRSPRAQSVETQQVVRAVDTRFILLSGLALDLARLEEVTEVCDDERGSCHLPVMPFGLRERSKPTPCPGDSFNSTLGVASANMSGSFNHCTVSAFAVDEFSLNLAAQDFLELIQLAPLNAAAGENARSVTDHSRPGRDTPGRSWQRRLLSMSNF